MFHNFESLKRTKHLELYYQEVWNVFCIENRETKLTNKIYLQSEYVHSERCSLILYEIFGFMVFDCTNSVLDSYKTLHAYHFLLLKL